MTHEEAQRLLGGYATNSLSEVERKALFEAALEDQELFDALHGEQALKDLLDDEISRAQVRAALQGSSSGMATRPWWRRSWTWGLAGGLAAAAVTIAVVAVVNQPHPSQQRVEMAMADKPLSAERAAPAPARPPSPSEMMARLARKERENKVEGRRSAKEELTHSPRDRKDVMAQSKVAEPAAAAPASPLPQEQLPDAGQSQQSTLELQKAQQLPSPGQVPAPASAANNAMRDQESAAQGQPRAAAARGGVAGGIAGFASSTGSLKSTALSYSLLKRNQSGGFTRVDSNDAIRQGDAVRLMVSPPASGYLNLYERDANGAWKPIRLAPSNEDGVKVNANTPYVVPEQPIDVKEQEQLRLVLSAEPVAVDAVSQPDARKKSAKRAIEIEPLRGGRGLPITVDITLTGKKE
jgi:hypothetical protein